MWRTVWAFSNCIQPNQDVKLNAKSRVTLYLKLINDKSIEKRNRCPMKFKKGDLKCRTQKMREWID